MKMTDILHRNYEAACHVFEVYLIHRRKFPPIMSSYEALGVTFLEFRHHVPREAPGVTCM
jgi:hypothetical protein